MPQLEMTLKKVMHCGVLTRVSVAVTRPCKYFSPYIASGADVQTVKLSLSVRCALAWPQTDHSCVTIFFLPTLCFGNVTRCVLFTADISERCNVLYVRDVAESLVFRVDLSGGLAGALSGRKGFQKYSTVNCKF